MSRPRRPPEQPETENQVDRLGEIRLSSCYALVLERAVIGHLSALSLKVRHEASDGVVTFRGGFLIPVDALVGVIYAMQKAHAALETGDGR